MGNATKVWILMFCGVLLAQGAWILAVPPFRALDEFDHAYRAAGVSHGQYVLKDPAIGERGNLVWVPSGLVKAAERQCEALEYTSPGNCRAIREEGGMAQVATGAASYNPVFYWAVGSFASHAEGTRSLYLMRIAAAVLCAVTVATGALALRGRGRTWTRFGFVVALTPALVYASVVPSPNGIEMAAGLVLASSLLRVRDGGTAAARWIAVAGAASVVLVVVRPLGAVWFLVGLAGIAFFVGWSQCRSLALLHRRPLIAFLGVVGLALVGSLMWTAVAPVTTEPGFSGSEALEANWLKEVVSWSLQLIGSFPLRNEPAHPAVYACVALTFIGLTTVAMLEGQWRHRVAIGGVTLVGVVLFPITFTVATHQDIGLIWQGRYALPLLVTVPVLCGAVLDQHREPSSRRRYMVRNVALGVLALGHVLAPLFVLRGESDYPPSMADPAWIQPGGPAAIVVLTLAAWSAIAFWAMSGDRGVPRETGDRTLVSRAQC